MKKIITGILAAMIAFCIGCSEEDNTPALIKPEETGIFTDADGQTYRWAKYGDLYWMTENYRGGTSYYEKFIDDGYGNNSFSLGSEESEKAHFAIYGNYYSYKEALESAPAGWYLPGDEDWKKLEQLFGMSASEANARGSRGISLGKIFQSEETLGLRLGGLIIAHGRPTYLKLRHARIYGYYWTETKDDTSVASAIFSRKILTDNVSSEIERNSLSEGIESYNVVLPTYMNVRYVTKDRPE